MPRFAIRSITGTAESNAARALSALPVSTAAITCLIFVRTSDRRLALCARCLSFCRARFRAWGEFATQGLHWGQKRSRIIRDTLSVVNRSTCPGRSIEDVSPIHQPNQISIQPKRAQPREAPALSSLKRAYPYPSGGNNRDTIPQAYSSCHEVINSNIQLMSNDAAPSVIKNELDASI